MRGTRDTPHPGLPIVIVDDNPVDAALASGMLSKLGHESTVIEDPRAVWNYVAGHEAPRLVILDMCMPDFNGLQVLEHIRRHPIWRRVPVLVVSGLTMRQDVLEALKAGASGYLVKPYQFDRLKNEIERLLGPAA